MQKLGECVPGGGGARRAAGGAPTLTEKLKITDVEALERFVCAVEARDSWRHVAQQWHVDCLSSLCRHN